LRARRKRREDIISWNYCTAAGSLFKILKENIKCMTVSYWLRGKLKEELSADTCILGAGITGAACAYWIQKRRPEKRVVVVDRRSAASGASGRNAGMVLAGLSDHYDRMIDLYGRERAGEAWQATIDHNHYLREFLNESGADVEADYSGSFRLGFEEDERAHLERSADLLQMDGFAAQYLEDDPTGRGFYGALGIKEDFGLHPVLLVNALLEASGATLLTHNEVYSIEKEREGLSVLTTQSRIRCRDVIIALNAFSPMVESFFEPYVTAHRGQILITEPIGRRVLDRLVYTHNGYIYFRQLPDTRLLVGGFRHQFFDVEAGFLENATTDVQSALDRFTLQRFPEAAEARVEVRWAGTMGFRPMASLW
jgi:gamma-glutamylputrescine oxidase